MVREVTKQSLHVLAEARIHGGDRRRTTEFQVETLLRVAGVDERGWIKGRRYRLLILDLGRRKVLDFPPDKAGSRENGTHTDLAGSPRVSPQSI